MPSGEVTNPTSEAPVGAAVVAVAASSVDTALPEAEKELARLPPEAEEEPVCLLQEPADAAGNGSAVVETLDDAQRLFDEGRDALRSEDYEQATELLSRALEIRARHYGELAIECAFTYYKYGCALLYKAQSESDPLGEVTEATEPSSNEARETGGETNGEQQEEEDLEEEEESDLDMAWKMLDIARVIYEKQQSHSIEEVDTITALADISLEREDFDMCFRDYTKALEIMEGLVEPDDRGIAELCFKLCLAQQLGYKPKEALRYCQQAVSVCEARLKRLRNEVAVARGTADPKGKSAMYSDTHKESLRLAREDQPSLQPNASVATENTSCKKQEDEIKEIEQLLEDLRDKVVELEEMASGPSLLDSLKETNPGALNSIKQVFSVTAQLASQETNGGNTSHAEPSNGGFVAPSMSASAVPVTHLGVVGRGVKRATPVCMGASGAVTSEWLAQAEAALPLVDSKPYSPSSSSALLGRSPSNGGAPFSVIEEFNYWRSKPELAEAVAAIKALTAVIQRSEATTMMGLEIELKKASEALKAWDETSISLSAGCDLFTRYVTRTSALEYEDIRAGKARLIERGERFGEISLKARKTIAMLGQDFVRDGSTILTHGFSRVVLAILKLAASNKKHFSVICTEGRPDSTGIEMAKEMVAIGVPVTLIIDSAVAYTMQRIDMLLIGADGVVESGGIINMIGTYQAAMVARSMNKPVYVAAESYKFARMYPLDQRDMSPAPRRVDFQVPLPPAVQAECSARDYTPPQYLTLLFTDLGVLTPSAVSDELIQLYL